MVGIVVVSHSEKLAQGVVELAALMAPDVPMAAAGGMEDGGFGTSYEKIKAALERVCGPDGALVFMDMGSAVMTGEMVLEDLPDRRAAMVDCPLVEGVVAAAIASVTGQDMEAVARAATETRSMKKLDG